MAFKIKAQITFISAGAGSGKTHRLTEILRHELLTGSSRPSGVIATTFTKKAATQLRERVREDLLGHGQFGLANAMGQARIGTVHSVCGQIIARFAFEAGLSTDQQVVDEMQSAILLDHAIDAVLDGPGMQELLRVATRLGLGEGWKTALQALVNQTRSNDIAPDKLPGLATANANDLLRHFPGPTQQDIHAALLQAIQSALPTIEATARKNGQKNTLAYLQLVQAFARALESAEAPWGEWIKVSRATAGAALLQTTEPIAALAQRVEECPGLHADVRRYLELMFALAAQALTKYQVLKQDLGVLDFADQEQQLLGLLDHPEVAAVLDDELDLLLVDEFQDTSPIQLALFLKLARFAKKVYWVGDVKQAIYGFRGSDAKLMQTVIESLPDMGGVKEILPSSWRSRPELVQMVNAVFTNAFRNTLPAQEIQLQAERTQAMPDPALANWLLNGGRNELRASALACGVRKLIDSGYQIYDKSRRSLRPVRFGDIAILSSTHDGVAAYAGALSDQGIPVATAQPGLLATPEATLALACLRRLNDSADTLATAEIVSLADSLAPETWVTDRLQYLAQNGDPDEWLERSIEGHLAHPILEIIARLRSALPVLSPREALAAVITACNIPDKVVRWSTDSERTRSRLANLEALLELAEQYEDLCLSGQHAASISGLILWLAETAREAQDMLAEPGIDAVKVMTHHAAKGLEWPVVILTDLAKDIKDSLWSVSAQSAARFDVQNPLKDRYIRYWPWPFGRQTNAAVADTIALTPMAKDLRNTAIEESKRLLYVSMTRARDLLVLARPQNKLTGEWLDAVEAPWLLQNPEQNAVALPSGQSIAAQCWSLDPLNEPGEGQGQQHTLYWFQSTGAVRSRLPLSFNPSSAGMVQRNILEKCQFGTRIPVGQGADMAVLGTAMHACIALSFTDRTVALSEKEVQKILSGFGVLEQLSPSNVLQQVRALHDWIASRWPDAKAHAEIPVQSVLSNGQILNGRIDLLLDTADGWILIDHKSSQLRPEHWDQLADEHAAQMAAYAGAVHQASGRQVIENWLFFPVVAGAMRIEFS